jgi:indolepyruvate ferredoxin oxidoreductase
MLLAGINADNYEIAVDIASMPEHIRGYGHVKDAHLKDAREREAELVQQFRNPQASAKLIKIRAAA